MVCGGYCINGIVYGGRNDVHLVYYDSQKSSYRESGVPLLYRF